MFVEMRRKKNQMSHAKTMKILKEAEYGILGTISENGYPYTVPLNYVFYQEKIYFHSAFSGHKIININYDEKVSFTVVNSSKVIEEEFTTKYESVTLFGTAKCVGYNKEVLLKMMEKYSPNYTEKGAEHVKNDFSSALIIEIEIQHITGKERL